MPGFIELIYSNNKGTNDQQCATSALSLTAVNMSVDTENEREFACSI